MNNSIYHSSVISIQLILCVYVCMCKWVWVSMSGLKPILLYFQSEFIDILQRVSISHKYMLLSIYNHAQSLTYFVYIYVCVCVCVCAWMHDVKEDNESLRDRTKELRAELARLRRREQRLFADELHQGEASSALNAEAKKAQGENNHVHDTRGPSSTISSIPNDRMKGTVVTSSTAGNAHGHRTNKIRKKTVKAKHIPQEQRTQKARRAYLLNGGGPSFRPQASVTGKKGLQSKRRIGKMGRRNTISVGSGLSSWNRR